MYSWTMFAFSYFNRCGSFCAGMNPGVGDAGAAAASSGTRAAASSGTRSPVEASAVPPSTRWMPPGPPPGPPPSKAMPKERPKPTRPAPKPTMREEGPPPPPPGPPPKAKAMPKEVAKQAAAVSGASAENDDK